MKAHVKVFILLTTTIASCTDSEQTNPIL